MAKTGGGAWPFYVSGPLLAVLTVLSLYLFDSPVGMGDAMTVASEYCVESVESRRLAAPPMDWQFGLLFGIFIGALGMAALARDLKPKLSSETGPVASGLLRTALLGLAGGFLVMTGVQLAGDSVLGQFSAGIQLSGAAWVFLIAFAASAVLLTVLLAQRGGGKSSAGKPAGKASAAKKSAAKGKGK